MTAIAAQQPRISDGDGGAETAEAAVSAAAAGWRVGNNMTAVGQRGGGDSGGRMVATEAA